MAKKMGRPTAYTEELGDDICERLMNGESLRSICDASEMPNRSTVFRWLHMATLPNAEPYYVEFSTQYARAREEQADAIFDECLQIADNATNDYMTSIDGEGATAYKLNGEHIQRSRLRVDTRKWMAGKLRPKRYGEKIDVNNTHDISDPMKEMLAGIAAKGRRVGDG